MKRLAIVFILLFAAAGYVYLQTAAPVVRLATLMPSGAMLCLETPDFAGLLRDWDASQVKPGWLGSANYEVFSRSNLFTKLSEVYGQYGEAAGFLPDLKGIVEIAGKNSALALYEVRDVEFLYISQVAEADLLKSQLWAVRSQFEQRQAGGTTFYLRTDAASKRTVAFAVAKGCLFVGTRDDLVAQSLELLGGGGNPNLAADRWYRDAVAQAAEPGDLRLVMNMEAVAKSVYFRSYWVQRNAATVRQFYAGVADMKRSSGNITEKRAFLRAPDPARVTRPTVISSLLPLVPAEAGMYKASAISNDFDAAALVVQKLIGSPPESARDWRDAPYAVSLDSRSGSESDLETRIDEQPLSPDAGLTASIAEVRGLIEKARAQGILLVQSSVPVSSTFVQTPSVIVLSAAGEWDANAVRGSLAMAAGKLWSTSQLGAGWIGASTGRIAFERLDGLGSLVFAVRGPLLFLGNDARLLETVLDRTGTGAIQSPVLYAAGVRALRESANYERVMTALDFTSRSPNGAPAFFSGNIGSLIHALSQIAEVRFTEEDRGTTTLQTVTYQLAP